MKIKRSGSLAMVAAISAIAVILMPTQAVIAQDQPGLLQVAEVKVKNGDVGEFVSLQRQYAEAARADGRTGRNVWQVVRGRTNTFHIVEGAGNYASYDEDLDPPLEGQAWGFWVSQIVDTIESRTVVNLRPYPDLAIAAPEGEAPALAVLRIRTIQPGRNDDYEEWVRDDLLPALEAGGQTGVSYFRVHMGGNPNTWFGVTRHASWAELDPPGPLDGMSNRARSSLLDKAADMSMGVNENLVIQHRADMSY